MSDAGSEEEGAATQNLDILLKSVQKAKQQRTKEKVERQAELEHVAAMVYSRCEELQNKHEVAMRAVNEAEDNRQKAIRDLFTAALDPDTQTKKDAVIKRRIPATTSYVGHPIYSHQQTILDRAKQLERNLLAVETDITSNVAAEGLAIGSGGGTELAKKWVKDRAGVEETLTQNLDETGKMLQRESLFGEYWSEKMERPPKRKTYSSRKRTVL